MAHLYDPFHPAVVRLLGDIVTAASAAKVPLSVCGEMAASREGALLLVGLGYRELSMAPSAIRQVRHALASARVAEMERAVLEVAHEDALSAESFAAALGRIPGGPVKAARDNGQARIWKREAR